MIFSPFIHLFILCLFISFSAGQERFRTLTSAYYRGAHGIILVYDITNRESFESIQHWLKEIDIYSTNEDAVKMLIGNKTDEGEEKRKVSKSEGSKFARDHGMLFIEASAKTQEGVNQAFEELLEKILDVPALLGESAAAAGNRHGNMRIQRDNEDENENSPQGGCCF